jgi:hypothetical protein
MIGAATIINPVIKIVTTVAILAAAYLLIVKPVLETTDNVVDRSFDAFDQSFQAGLDDLPGPVQSQVNRAFDGSRGSQPQRLHDCIQRAFDAGGTPSTRQVDRCVRRFGPG